MSSDKDIRLPRSIPIAGVWYDHFANHWYEYPRKARTTTIPQIPSICLRGHWITEAGFAIGEKMEVRVSGDSIVLTVKRKGEKVV